MNVSNLWSTGADPIPRPAERKSALTQPIAQAAYDAVLRIQSSIHLMRQCLGSQGNMGTYWAKFIADPLPKCEEALQGLLSQLGLERYAGVFPANQRVPQLDPQWVESLPDAANGMIGADRIAPLLLTLFADGKKA